MSGFSAEWLGLREPYDLAARNGRVLAAVTDAFAGATFISVLDLACGTGSTLRAIAEHLPARQHWRLVDNDLGLLAKAATLGRPPNINVLCRPVDLVRDLELALEGPLDLVTTSALLDLVSLQWLERLIIETAARHLPVYAALTYDGRVALAPGEELDDDVIAAFHAHQLTDKGFGPALGPTAAARAAERFEHFGYGVLQATSDWVLGSADRAIQETLFGGWAELALLRDIPADGVHRWLASRRALVTEGRSNLRIGHIDIFARPIGTR